MDNSILTLTNRLHDVKFKAWFNDDKGVFINVEADGIVSSGYNLEYVNIDRVYNDLFLKALCVWVGNPSCVVSGVQSENFVEYYRAQQSWLTDAVKEKI
jgi:hypothetical protein